MAAPGTGEFAFDGAWLALHVEPTLEPDLPIIADVSVHTSSAGC